MKMRCNLIDARERKGMSQAKAAVALGMTRSAINSIERGIYSPSKEYLDKLIDFFDLTQDGLLELSEPKEKEAIMQNEYEIRGEVTAILLKYKGEIIETIIDTSDLPRALEMPNSWCASYDKTLDSCYVTSKITTKDSGRVKIRLHRWLYGELDDTVEIDHIFHDTLDNRRSCSLRKVLQGKNTQNRKGAQRNNYCGILGISKVNENKYRARIQINGKSKHIGYYENEVEAERAVREARAKHMPYSQEALAN